LIDPKWNFELEHFDVERFFEEAKVTADGVQVLRTRFDKFCSVGKGDIVECVSEADDEPHLNFEDFCRLNEHYSVCKPREAEHYFRAMLRGSRHCRLFFQDFLLGCAAANPSTPHILNSFTGYVRARYIFDFYNVSRSGTLEYEELAQLLTDARRNLNEGQDAHRQLITEVAQELGDVSVVTLHVDGLAGHLCSLRVSTRWTGLRVRREIARQLEVPVEGQQLQVHQRSLDEGEILDTVLCEDGATSAKATLVSSNWDKWPCTPAPSASDGVVGLERLVHVTFQRFYKSLVSEQLRGTSRLYRFHRSILHTKAQVGGGGGALGGA
jgi:hypothetical protein